MFLHQKTKKTRIHNPKKGVGIGEKKRRSRKRPWWGEVAKRRSSAGQLNFKNNSLVAVSLCEFRTAEQGIRKDDKNSTNFRITVTKKFYEKLKRVGGVNMGHLSQISTLVKTAYLKLLLYAVSFVYLAFLMMKSFSLWCHRLLFAK